MINLIKKLTVVPAFGRSNQNTKKISYTQDQKNKKNTSKHLKKVDIVMSLGPAGTGKTF